MFSRLVVLLDHLAPQAGVCTAVRQWQQKVHWPVHVVAVPGREQPFVTLGKWLGCRPELMVVADNRLRSLWQSLRPDDLLLLGSAVLQTERNWVLRQLLEPGSPAVLVCPDRYRPLERVLVLDQGGRSSALFLRHAVMIASSLNVAPIVLTVARTEREARVRQGQARKALDEENVDINFDFVVSSQAGRAAVHVARWRHAQLVIMEPPCLAPWQRWLRGNPLARFADELAALPLLALPEMVRYDQAPARSAPFRSQLIERALVKFG